VKLDAYLLDTHALIFWNSRVSVSIEFIRFFDKQDLVLVTKDQNIQKYNVKHFWI